ncbi:MAG TPA: radical SAM protein [Longilinea sp.]|nr:radical SAM protein [Longilinea sp.]
MTEHMALETDGDFSTGAPVTCGISPQSQPGVVFAAAAGGKRVKLLKTLLTSACERDCLYCPFRAGRDFRRETLRPDELSTAFLKMHHAGLVEGLFLSSGIAGGGMKTQDRLLASAEILRNKLGYRGYLHLKIMPGAEKSQVERAMQLADRISINLESPNEHRLGTLAPHKDYWKELFTPLQWAEEIRQSLSPEFAWKGRWPSLTTQFVVGAVGETDLELLSTSEFLFRNLRLARTYYSAFTPVADTPLQDQPPENPIRQLRLYQSAFLLRDYGYDLEDLPFLAGGSLPLEIDPKLAWAKLNLSEQPVEITQAESSQLLRIPGIGVKTARRILKERRKNTIQGLSDLQRLGIPLDKAGPYILVNGKKPDRQMSLW